MLTMPLCVDYYVEHPAWSCIVLIIAEFGIFGLSEVPPRARGEDGRGHRRGAPAAGAPLVKHCETVLTSKLFVFVFPMFAKQRRC